MKCPLLLIAVGDDRPKVNPKWGDCLEEECAWWDNIDSQCIIQSTETNLLHIGKMLQDIEDKMPHEEQFRK